MSISQLAILSLPDRLAMLELTTGTKDMEAISSQTLRIIDANLNRIGEGLRLLEDVSRLLLNDGALTQQLKNMRHELVRGERSLL